MKDRKSFKKFRQCNDIRIIFSERTFAEKHKDKDQDKDKDKDNHDNLDNLDEAGDFKNVTLAWNDSQVHCPC